MNTNIKKIKIKKGINKLKLDYIMKQFGDGQIIGIFLFTANKLSAKKNLDFTIPKFPKHSYNSVCYYETKWRIIK